MAVIEDEGESSAKDIEDAKGMVKSVFGVMEIRRVIVVDDQLSNAPDVSAIVGAIQALQSRDKSIPSVAEFKAIDFAKPEELWRPTLATAWETMEMTRRYEVAGQFGIGGEAEIGEERSVLQTILEDYDPRFLSLTEWNAEKSGLIEAAKSESILFLFDQDMTGNKGAPDEGMKAIAAILKAQEPPAQSYFGLMSHHVKINEEYGDHHKFVDKYELKEQRHRFAVISKKHLEQAPSALALRLKRVAIGPLCEQLKDQLITSITGSVEEAKNKLDELEIYDFEQIVFRSSYQEGVWEADTLLRLFGIFHQECARTRAARDGVLRSAADKVRSVVEMPYKPDDFRGSRVHEIANLELYERGEYLLEHRMPIALGDMFQKVDGGRKYILIEQPCDLMVRGDTGGRELNDVILAEIYERPTTDEKAPPLSFVELPFLSKDPATKSYAKMAKCVTVPVAILDLCVFSDDASATFIKGVPCPNSAIPAWKKRYEVLQKECSAFLGRYKGFTHDIQNKSVDGTLQGAVLRTVKGVLAGRILLSSERIEYNFKRIGRLKEPRASGLLRKFSAYKSRDAFDHNLTAAYESVEKQD